MSPTPNASCSTTAVTGSASNLMTDIARLRDSCTPPRMRPMVLSSKTRLAPVSATPTANSASRAGVPLISGKWPPNAEATSGKPSPRTSDPSPAADDAAATSPPGSRRFREFSDQQRAKAEHADRADQHHRRNGRRPVADCLLAELPSRDDPEDEAEYGGQAGCRGEAACVA